MTCDPTVRWPTWILCLCLHRFVGMLGLSALQLCSRIQHGDFNSLSAVYIAIFFGNNEVFLHWSTRSRIRRIFLDCVQILQSKYALWITFIQQTFEILFILFTVHIICCWYCRRHEIPKSKLCHRTVIPNYAPKEEKTLVYILSMLEKRIKFFWSYHYAQLKDSTNKCT